MGRARSAVRVVRTRVLGDGAARPRGLARPLGHRPGRHPDAATAVRDSVSRAGAAVSPARRHEAGPAAEGELLARPGVPATASGIAGLRCRNAAVPRESGDRIGGVPGAGLLGPAVPHRRHAELRQRPARLLQPGTPPAGRRPVDLGRDRPRRHHDRRRGAAVSTHGHAHPGRSDRELPAGLHAPDAGGRHRSADRRVHRNRSRATTTVARAAGTSVAGPRVHARQADRRRAAVRGRSRHRRTAAQRRQNRRRGARTREHRLPHARGLSDLRRDTRAAHRGQHAGRRAGPRHLRRTGGHRSVHEVHRLAGCDESVGAVGDHASRRDADGDHQRRRLARAERSDDVHQLVRRRGLRCPPRDRGLGRARRRPCRLARGHRSRCAGRTTERTGIGADHDPADPRRDHRHAGRTGRLAVRPRPQPRGLA